jgi:hypothetical protein
MNLASCLGFSTALAAAATLMGCLDEPYAPPPYYAPTSAPPPRRGAAPQPLPVTHLPYYEYQSSGDYGTARPRSPYTIDLGYIGDWQFGEGEATPSAPPSWARPFPCNWTRTCGMVGSSPDFGATRYGYAMPR